MNVMPAGIPAMPGVLPDQGSSPTDPRLLAPTAGKYFIGWLPRSASEGGTAFAIVRCSVLGQLKALECFPLTEHGWAQAWQALVRIDRDAAEKARPVLAEQARQTQDNAELDELSAATIGYVADVVFLGGYAPA
jgi:hypothetical protein